MGWFKLLLNSNNAEGCREAMRMSYKKHLRQGQRMVLHADTSPHHVGLYGALSTRYKSAGMPVVEMVIWAELAPFLLMKETDAVESLAEYVVYKERPLEAKVSWLKKLINDAFQMVPSSEESSAYMELAPMGMINQVAWCNLLDPDIRSAIEEKARKIIPAFNEDAE